MKAGYTLQFAEPQDIGEWMDFVAVVEDHFPGLDPEAYLNTLKKNIARRTAICVKHRGRIVGVLLYSVKAGCLSCMAVHPAHRRKGIASAMVERMLSRYPADQDLWVSTFRQGDALGVAPRAFYLSLGFAEDALTEEFGYPVQRFVLHRGQSPANGASEGRPASSQTS